MADVVVEVFEDVVVVEVIDSGIVLVEIGGSQGPAGPSGASTTDSAIAGMNISSYHAVVLLNGLLYHADSSTISHADHVVGISAQSGLAGTSIQYQSTGELSGGSFITDSKYFVGTNGSLTTSVPQSPNWLKSMAVAKDNSTLVVNLGQTFLRG